jgi:transposase
VDTSEQMTVEVARQVKRRKRSVEEKRRIVEESLEVGASVARVARRHEVNANQVFCWRKKYREGRLGKGQSGKLLPVALSDNSWGKSGRASCASSPSAVGSMEIKLAKRTVRVQGTRIWIRNARANGKRHGRPKSKVDRERILELKAHGLSLRQIAKKLGVGYGTVRARLLASHKIQSQG